MQDAVVDGDGGGGKAGGDRVSVQTGLVKQQQYSLYYKISKK